MSTAPAFTWSGDRMSEFERLSQNAPWGLAQFDCGILTAINPILEEMLGEEFESMGSRSLSDILNCAEERESGRLLAGLLDGSRSSLQLQSAIPGNPSRKVRWSVWRVSSANGSTDVLLATAESANENPSIEQLQRAERLEAVGRLAGGVAHDFNNLLTGVLLYCDLLLATLEPGQRARKFAEEIRKAGMQASGLVRQLLAISKPAQGASQLISLNEIAEGMRNFLNRLIGENIDVRFSLDLNLGLIKMDPAQAQQILLNLVLNARDAMPTGGRITVSTSNCNVQMFGNSPGSGRAALPCALLVVEDNGIGMDATTRSHLFEPFFTTKLGTGTGLGLTTVHGVVSRNGGLIHVDSEPGKGTRINVLMPLASPIATESSCKPDFHPANDTGTHSMKEERLP